MMAILNFEVADIMTILEKIIISHCNMTLKKPYKLYRITYSHIFWSLLTGIVIVLFAYPEVFLSFKWTFFALAYSLSMGIPFQKISEYMEIKLDESNPWLKNPVRRLLITSVYQSILGIAMLLIVNFVLYIFIRKTTAFTFIEESTHALKYVLISVPIFIPITKSLIFFKSWRQSALNEEILKRERLTMEYEILKNQVNPHFFFNSLTALISLVRTDQEKAVEFIEQFSKIFRYRLDHHQNQVVNLLTEKKIVEAVAFLYQIRFKNELLVNIDLPNSTDKFIVPMALQMLIENAVKHNMASIEKPLKIDLWLNDEYIIVQNNLQPKRTNTISNKIGLKNIQSQYKYLSKKEVIIEHTEEFFTVKIPILNSI